MYLLGVLQNYHNLVKIIEITLTTRVIIILTIFVMYKLLKNE